MYPEPVPPDPFVWLLMSAGIPLLQTLKLAVVIAPGTNGVAVICCVFVASHPNDDIAVSVTT